MHCCTFYGSIEFKRFSNLFHDRYTEGANVLVKVLLFIERREMQGKCVVKREIQHTDTN